MPAARRLGRRSFGGGNPDEAQSLAMALGKRLDREGRRRAGAKPDDHAVLHQPDRSFRRLPLEGVPVGLARRRRRTHGATVPAAVTAAAALPRMAVDGDLVVLRSKDCRAGNDRRGARRCRLSSRRHVFTSIDLDHRLQAAFRADRPDAPDLRQHLGQEGLSAEPGIDRHDQDDIAEVQDIFDELRRARRVEHHARLLAELPDLAEHPMQMHRGAWLGLDQQMVGACLGEGRKIAFRLDDHQMHVERLCCRAADGLQHERTDGDVGHEAAVHHIDVDPVGAGRVDGADLLAQSREIRGQHRRCNQNRPSVWPRDGRGGAGGIKVSTVHCDTMSLRMRRKILAYPTPAAARSTNQMSSPTGLTRAAGRSLPPARIAPKDRRLFLARNEESDMPAALDHRIGHGDADLGPPMRHGGHPALAFFQHRFARQQRCGMAIGPEPEQGDVEQRLAPDPAPWRHRPACRVALVAQGGLVGRAISRHGVDVLRRHGHLGQHRLARHPVVALGMVVGDEALVAPVPGYALPRETVRGNASEASSPYSVLGVDPPESDTRKGPGVASAAVVIHSATWRASDSGSGSTSMRPIILLVSPPQSDNPRTKRSIALAKPSSL